MFVSAGLQTATSIFDKNFPDKRCLIEKYIQKGLASFGKKIHKYPKNYVNRFLKEYSTFDNYRIEKYIDSGGYQIATQQIPKKFIHQYIRDYSDFLQDHSDIYDYAFSLDIPNNESYPDKDESIKLNSEAIEAIIKKAPLDKMLFVLQFRTLDLYETWEPLVENYLQYFKNFSIGGLVVAQQSLKLLPFSFTAIGIGTFLSKWKGQKIKSKFHVLGNSTYKDVIYYILLENHFREELGIDLTVTYDSSNLFKKFQIARFFTYWSDADHTSMLVSAKEKDLNTKVYNNLSAFDIIRNECIKMAEGCNLDKSFPGNIYTEDKKFNNTFRPYTTILEGYEQTKFEQWAKEIVSNVYLDFYHKDKNKFTENLTAVLARVNKQPVKQARILTNTLDFLNNDITIDKIKGTMKSYSFLTDSESFDKPAQFSL